jgi:molybdopterin converting factor small subunit
LITVKVRLLASLRRYLPAGSSGDRAEVVLPDSATVSDLVVKLGIPSGRAAMVMSGDERLDETSVLREGQEVSLLPPLAGGA